MLDSAANSSAEINLKFNPRKCQLLKLGPRYERSLDPISVHFCGQEVDRSTKAIHLGHYIGENYQSETIARAVNALNRRIVVVILNPLIGDGTIPQLQSSLVLIN